MPVPNTKTVNRLLTPEARDIFLTSSKSKDTKTFVIQTPRSAALQKEDEERAAAHKREVDDVIKRALEENKKDEL